MTARLSRRLRKGTRVTLCRPLGARPVGTRGTVLHVYKASADGFCAKVRFNDRAVDCFADEIEVSP